MEHKEVIRLEDQGKLLIGIDRGLARKFYTGIPMSKIQEKTGESPYLETIMVRFVFWFAPVVLIASIVLGFFAFRWWGVICLTLCPIIFSWYFALSSLGDSKLVGITILSLAIGTVHFSGYLNTPWITGFSSAFLLSLWCVRFLYCSSTFFLREFITRNEKAFEWLLDDLTIRYNE